MSMHTNHCMPVGVRGQNAGVSSPHWHVGPRDLIWVTWFGGKCLSHWVLSLTPDFYVNQILLTSLSLILTFNFSTSSHFQHHAGLSWWRPLALAHRFPFAPQSSWLPCLWSKSFSCVKWECQNKFPSTHKASQGPAAQSSGIHYHLNICCLTRYFLRDPGQATSSVLISFSPPHWTMKLS